MLKQTVTYEDFDGRTQTEDLYFNISKVEITEHLDLEERFRDVISLFDGGPREWTRPEVEKYLGLVKHVMAIAYGQRSADGKRFRKSPEIWQDFKDSAAYDAYLFSLFTDPDKANKFLTGVLPADLRAEAQKEIEKNGGELPTGDKLDEVRASVAESSIESPMTDEELLRLHPMDMTEEQAKRAFEIRFGTK